MQRSLTLTLTHTRLSAVAPRPFLILQRTKKMSASSTPIRVPSPLVSVAWLKEHLSQVKVIDGSLYMPNEKRDPLAEHLQGRIKGAVFFDLEKCTTKGGVNLHALPSKEQLEEYASSLGLSRDDAMVVYDGKGIFSSPRIRFTLQHFGARNVAILEGGWKAWKEEKGEIESGEQRQVERGNFVASTPPADFIQTLDTVKANSESDSREFLLIDARSAGRFAGTEPEPRPDMPSGHIAGSVSVPFMSLLTTDAKTGATHMKSPPELKAAFEQQGVDPADGKRKIVASCGSGVTACVDLLGLELLGRTDNLGLYSGSWAEWAASKQKIVTAKK
jgi:thiosulfate/3-mercaptopyruvate sulfurtransferase